jgi:hypothetical protein
VITQSQVAARVRCGGHGQEATAEHGHKLIKEGDVLPPWMPCANAYHIVGDRSNMAKDLMYTRHNVICLSKIALLVGISVMANQTTGLILLGKFCRDIMKSATALYLRIKKKEKELTAA